MKLFREHTELIARAPFLLPFSKKAPQGDSNYLTDILEISGVDLSAVRAGFDDLLKTKAKISGGSGQVYASAYLNKLLVLAEDEAKKDGNNFWRAPSSCGAFAQYEKL